MEVHRTEILRTGAGDPAGRDTRRGDPDHHEHPYGNGASIYTQNGWYARKFKMETQAGDDRHQRRIPRAGRLPAVRRS